MISHSSQFTSAEQLIREELKLAGLNEDQTAILSKAISGRLLDNKDGPCLDLRGYSCLAEYHFELERTRGG